ncbi:MAG: PAS domain-containing protein [Deltaproteobacteria bacterium]|nr:PAS domain-containing protein [Deltaproteobacteria bacterium]MBI3296426.1 PAS domain-containing protein [Deltaproteobacteria bacterium]
MRFLERFILTRKNPGIIEGTQWFLLVRLIVLFLALAWIVVAQALGTWSAVNSEAAYGILAFAFSFTMLTALALERLTPNFLLPGVQIAFDAIVTGLWLRWLGSEGGAISLFFIIQILASALTFQKRGAWFSSLSASLAFACFTGLSGGWVSLLVYGSLFWVIGGTGGYLAEELSRTAATLARKERTIVRLTELQEQILTYLPTGLLTVDHDLKVNFVNPEGAHILGLSPSQLVGGRLDVMAPQLLPFFSVVESEVIATGELGRDLEAATTGSRSHRSIFVHSKNDSRRLQQRVEVGSRVLRGDVSDLGPAIEGSGLLRANARGGRILIFQDVTIVDSLEERLRQNEKLAAVGQLAAGIAHEIRNPLASMSASIEMLKESYPAPRDENHRLMEITIREIDRLNGLITEFLEYVKPDKVTKVIFDGNHLIEEVVEAVRRRKDRPPGSALEVSIQGRLELLGHREKIKGVLLNLLINAVQAIGPHGRIEIGGKQEGGRTVVWVVDNGCGMKEEVKIHLFEPFFTTKPKGTGLGLAIAYKVIEAHDGALTVKSEVGKGSRFEISLPGRDA